MKTQRFKRAIFIFSIIAFLISAFGILGIVMIDNKDFLGSGVYAKSLFSELISALRIERINVSFLSLVAFGLTYLATLFLIVTLFIGIWSLLISVSKKKLIIYGSVSSAGVLAIICSWIIAPFVYSNKDCYRHMGLLWNYFVVSALAIFLILAIVFILVKLLVLFVSKGKEKNVLVQGKEGSAKKIFAGLLDIDAEFDGKQEKVENEFNGSLKELAERFQAYLSEKCELYYNIDMLRSFLAGLSTSRLIILEGLSGTGKSSLPRYFCEFIGSSAFFAPVQSTWRDRTDLLGFYNDFSGVFKESEFLKCLYKSSYTKNKFNVMVLDEMNLSRVEYYFADFLSVLEYPPEDWKISLLDYIDKSQKPKHLDNCSIKVPTNTWFVGTANKDDSTFTITDKVYDRAVVLDFDDRNVKVKTTAPSDSITLTPNTLSKMFNEAIKVSENNLSEQDFDKFNKLTSFVYDNFEIQFGNRIMRQITIYTPVYVALGGTKEGAIDIMFSRKILHKLEGRFEDYIKEGLIKLQALIKKVYGEKSLPMTEEMIKNMLKKLV